MNPELERLINLAVADGKITDRELEVLYRKAQELAVDMDEFEMVLEGKLHLAQKSTNVSQQSTTSSKSQKEGDVRKCPSCGAPALSFAATCSTCGHEFRNASAATSVQKLFDALQAAPLEAHASIISNFPVPNTREDILEFLSVSLGNCAPLTVEQKNSYVNLRSLVNSTELTNRESEIRAWQAKFSTVIQKARILLTDEIATRQISDFEKRYHDVVTSDSKEQKKAMRNIFIGLAAFLFVIIGLTSIGESFHSDDKVRESKRLEAIVEQINKAIEANDFNTALVKAAGLKWEYSDSWSHYEQEKKSWDEKRETMVQAIKEAQRTQNANK